MLKRLRQVNFVVNDLDRGVRFYDSYLGMKTVHTFQAADGRRAVLHAGDGTFVGLWHPGLGDAETSVFRESRGQGPYELVFETGDLDALASHLDRHGVHTSGVARMEGWRSVVVDQKSVNGARVRVVEVETDSNPWPLAGQSWEHAPADTTLCLRQVAVLVRDLDAAVAR